MQMFFKTGVRNFAVLTGKSYSLQLYFNLVPKDSSMQVFSCEYCEILMNKVFYRMPPVAVFVSLLK